MRYETSVDIHAPANRVWHVLTDVTRWPEWAASMSKVARLDAGPLAVGSRARVKQPRLPATVWRVSDIEPGRCFSWTASAQGVTTTGTHRLTVRGDGVVRVELGIVQSGRWHRWPGCSWAA